MPDKSPLVLELKRAGAGTLLFVVGFPVICICFLAGFICQMAVFGFVKGAKALDVFDGSDPLDHHRGDRKGEL